MAQTKSKSGPSKGKFRVKGKPPKPGKWYIVDAMFDETSGLKAMAVDGIPFRIVGRIEDSPVVEVPPSVSGEASSRISDIVKRGTGKIPLVFTNNIRFVRLRELSDVDAMNQMVRAIVAATPVVAPSETAVES